MTAAEDSGTARRPTDSLRAFCEMGMTSIGIFGPILSILILTLFALSMAHPFQKRRPDGRNSGKDSMMIRHIRHWHSDAAARRTRRASIAKVQHLDDHLLRDIGLTRGDIPYAQRRHVPNHRC
ncbi:DUF1127 domain-containing protein [Aliiruegeria haliotis]|uniref:DUF1127 domain-containing protein n=1 Tax=Aliiruegeria haliotis TaxID=1280846 RepID=UPI000D079925